jgi:hypothetical protein
MSLKLNTRAGLEAAMSFLNYFAKIHEMVGVCYSKENDKTKDINHKI